MATPALPAHLRELTLTLPDGASTSAYVATHPLATTRVRIHRLPELTPLGAWCAQTNTEEALVGGFYVREPVPLPLGDLWTDGVVQPSVPFLSPWNTKRACVHVTAGDAVRIARREDLPEAPTGDLLQAGPLLVRNGERVTGDDEGFSAGAAQFDSDITEGRHPRAALGTDGTDLIALVCDGRADDDAGLTIDELATAMLELGALDALNLDGGGSTSLVCGGALRNAPRESHGLPVPGGRAIATAIVFTAA
ncbi:MAG: phosphodiester glycosidase family protein [Solirubrobacteraceae bacterium]|nr:phosphodiester glycosidase family protein [Solirubrobacteraceae bacterium]